jgi:hypothetical protein
MNNYKYNDLTTMFLTENDWIQLAHEGGRRTMVDGDQAAEKTPQPIAKRTYSRVAKSLKHIALMKFIPKLHYFSRQHAQSVFNATQMSQLGVLFSLLQSLFMLLPPIGRRWLLINVSARDVNDGILLVVVIAIRLPSVVVQILVLLIAQRAGIS